jgi:hypothetical protein
MDTYLLAISKYCLDMFDCNNSNIEKLLNKSVDVLSFGKDNKVNLLFETENFDLKRQRLLYFVLNHQDNVNLKSLFYRLENATGVSEECFDDNIYLNIQTQNGKCFVHIKQTEKLDIIKAYFHIYHFDKHCRLQFAQLTKFGNSNNPELNGPIWATMVLSNWKVYCKHVNNCLNLVNNLDGL